MTIKRLRVAAALAAVLIVASAASSPDAPSATDHDEPATPTTSIAPNDPSVLFFSDNDDCAGIENGQAHPDWIEGQANADLNEDGTPTYGFAYNTGDSTTGEISWGFEQDAGAYSGDCVLAMGIDDAYQNRRAIRIFRRYDRNGDELPAQAYYSVWFYFPTEVAYEGQAQIGGQTKYGFWNVFQVKNRVNGQSLSAISVNAGKVVGDDHMSFYLWLKTPCGAVEECGDAFGINQVRPLPIPVGEWVHLEMYVDAQAGPNGQLTLWQNGQTIIKHRGITERTGTARRNWSVNNYGILHIPASHTLYVDDARIGLDPIHPQLFPSTQVIPWWRRPIDLPPPGGQTRFHGLPRRDLDRTAAGAVPPTLATGAGEER